MSQDEKLGTCETYLHNLDTYPRKKLHQEVGSCIDWREQPVEPVQGEPKWKTHMPGCLYSQAYGTPCTCGAEPVQGEPRRFRKKPVVIEAIRWNGINLGDFDRAWGYKLASAEGERKALVIQTLEGTMLGEVGDWIIKGVKGEIYPCKPDIFEATYEAAE